VKDTIVLHHSANPSTAPQYAGIVAYHREKFGPAQAPAYHYFVGMNGTLKQGHPEDYVCWHAGNYAVNLRSIGICLAGDFTWQQPTSQQVTVLTDLVTDIQQRWGIPDERIFLHREVRLQPTACPGTDLRALVFEERQRRIPERIAEVEAAVARASGVRKFVLSRLLDRLEKLVPSQDQAE
jgi:hypothetical protein